MFGAWSVAKYTFRQCLRMKVAGLFVVLLAVTLGAMPLLMKGDETLAGKTRTFLSYSASMTGLLLSLVTIFLAAGIVSSDVRNKQIFSVVTKPIARWQYILGRWFGVVMLDALLLVPAGAAIYGMAQYLRTGEAINPTDRRTVETEVFTARARVTPKTLDIDDAVRAKIAALRQQGRLDEIMAAFRAEANGNEDLAQEKLYVELRRQATEALQSVAPGRSMTWEFSGIDVRGSELSGEGSVVRVLPEPGLIEIRTGPRLLGRLTFQGPVRVNGVDGRVEHMKADSFVAGFSREQMSFGGLKSLAPGKDVRLVAEPTIQLTYKATPSSSPPGDALVSIWEIQSPSGTYFHVERRGDVGRRPATLVISARAVDEHGRMIARYINVPDQKTGFVTSVGILQEDVAVLYRVGSFEWNFARGIGLIFIQLAFLAGLGVMAGSFVSFPVACLICFAMLPFQIGREFLMDAVRPSTDVAARTLLGYVSYAIVTGMNFLLPDFARTSPGDPFVDGMHISWGYLGETAFWTLVVQTGVVLATACLIFHKRELARVQA